MLATLLVHASFVGPSRQPQQRALAHAHSELPKLVSAASAAASPRCRQTASASPRAVRARIIASSEDDIAAIHAEADAIFAVIDLDNDGAISRSELGGHLTAAGYTAAAVSKVFRTLDRNSDGSISQEEFRDGFVRNAPLRNAPGLGDYRSEFVEEIHAEADLIYDDIDHDGDGEISLTELYEHLLAPEFFAKDGGSALVDYSPSTIEKMFNTLDINEDGKVSREEMRDGFVRFSALRIALGNRQAPASYPIGEVDLGLSEAQELGSDEEYRNS